MVSVVTHLSRSLCKITKGEPLWNWPTQCRDYLILDLVSADTQEYHIGKYGQMRHAYL